MWCFQFLNDLQWSSTSCWSFGFATMWRKMECQFNKFISFIFIYFFLCGVCYDLMLKQNAFEEQLSKYVHGFRILLIVLWAIKQKNNTFFLKRWFTLFFIPVKSIYSDIDRNPNERGQEYIDDAEADDHSKTNSIKRFHDTIV